VDEQIKAINKSMKKMVTLLTDMHKMHKEGLAKFEIRLDEFYKELRSRITYESTKAKKKAGGKKSSSQEYEWKQWGTESGRSHGSSTMESHQYTRMLLNEYAKMYQLPPSLLKTATEVESMRSQIKSTLEKK